MKWGSCAQLRSAELAFRRLWPFRAIRKVRTATACSSLFDFPPHFVSAHNGHERPVRTLRYCAQRTRTACARPTLLRTTDTNGLCASYVTAHNGHERPVRVLRYCAQRTRTACARPTLLRTTDTNGLCASYVTAHNGHERPVRVLRYCVRRTRTACAHPTLLRTTDTNGLCASYVTAHNGHERPVRTWPLGLARGLRNFSGVFEDAEPGSAVGHIEQSVLPQDDVVGVTPREFRPAGIDLISEVARPRPGEADPGC